MSHLPVQVVVAAFSKSYGADDALCDLQQAQLDGVITIRDAKVVRIDEQGCLHIEDSGCNHGQHGVGGTIIGLMLESSARHMGTGALPGTVARSLRQSGLSQERLHQVGSAMQPGSSALVALFEQTWLDEVVDGMSETASDVVTATLDADVADQPATNGDARR